MKHKYTGTLYINKKNTNITIIQSSLDNLMSSARNIAANLYQLQPHNACIEINNIIEIYQVTRSINPIIV